MITILLCGDVMIGRGIDQIQRHSVDPRLFEPSVRSARTYVDLAVAASGPIPSSVAPEYVWGVALDELDAVHPDARLVNLETALTTSDDPWPGKDVLYRAHPENVALLEAARVDVCALANNHALDWGYAGLGETLDALRTEGIATVGAGPDLAEAQAPAIVQTPSGRVVIVALASTTSGVDSGWSAGPATPGVNLVEGWSSRTAETVRAQLEPIRRPGDVLVGSIHWGSNWGHDIPDAQRRLAHDLVDVAGVDVVHGHSSHHPRAIELYRDRLILYGCGDFITDYEGIGGYEEFRDDLVLAYLVTVDPTKRRLERLTMIPFQLHRFRLERPSSADTAWLRGMLDQTSSRFGVRVVLDKDRRSMSLRA